MKRILIFLLALAFCQASAQVDSGKVLPNRGKVSIGISIDNWHPDLTLWGNDVSLYNHGDLSWVKNPNREYFVIALLLLYSRYERDCWNDSTQVKRHFGDGRCVGWSYGWDDFHCESPGHYDAIVWIHPEANLDKKFIVWLRKQIEK